MTISEIAKKAKDDGVKYIATNPSTEFQYSITPSSTLSYCFTMNDLIRDDWEVIPKCKECGK